MKSFGSLSLACLLTLLLGSLALHAETGAASSIAADLPAAGAVQPGPECASPAQTPLPDLEPPTAGPLSSGVFYICINDILCNGGAGCTSGHCATEACGSFISPTCTFQTSGVSGCQVSSGCQAIGRSCGDL